MSAIDNLRSIGRGDTPADDGLLGNARCAWERGEVLGEESILAAFCAKPFADGDAIAVETAQGAGLIVEDDALIADVYNGRIGRLWRVGRGVAFPQEPAIDVAFDPDMRQQRGGVMFRAEDHPELSAAQAERLLAAVTAHIEQVRKTGALRVRAFVVRAFGTNETIAALLAIHTMGNETSRTASFSHAIVGIASDGAARIVSEQSRARPWSPRF